MIHTILEKRFFFWWHRATAQFAASGDAFAQHIHERQKSKFKALFKFVFVYGIVLPEKSSGSENAWRRNDAELRRKAHRQLFFSESLFR